MISNSSFGACRNAQSNRSLLHVDQKTVRHTAAKYEERGRHGPNLQKKKK